MFLKYKKNIPSTVTLTFGEDLLLKMDLLTLDFLFTGSVFVVSTIQ